MDFTQSSILLIFLISTAWFLECRAARLGLTKRDLPISGCTPEQNEKLKLGVQEMIHMLTHATARLTDVTENFQPDLPRRFLKWDTSRATTLRTFTAIMDASLRRSMYDSHTRPKSAPHLPEIESSVERMRTVVRKASNMASKLKSYESGSDVNLELYCGLQWLSHMDHQGRETPNPIYEAFDRRRTVSPAQEYKRRWVELPFGYFNSERNAKDPTTPFAYVFQDMAGPFTSVVAIDPQKFKEWDPREYGQQPYDVMRTQTLPQKDKAQTLTSLVTHYMSAQLIDALSGLKDLTREEPFQNLDCNAPNEGVQRHHPTSRKKVDGWRCIQFLASTPDVASKSSKSFMFLVIALYFDKVDFSSGIARYPLKLRDNLNPPVQPGIDNELVETDNDIQALASQQLPGISEFVRGEGTSSIQSPSSQPQRQSRERQVTRPRKRPATVLEPADFEQEVRPAKRPTYPIGSTSGQTEPPDANNGAPHRPRVQEVWPIGKESQEVLPSFRGSSAASSGNVFLSPEQPQPGIQQKRAAQSQAEIEKQVSYLWKFFEQAHVPQPRRKDCENAFQPSVKVPQIDFSTLQSGFRSAKALVSYLIPLARKQKNSKLLECLELANFALEDASEERPLSQPELPVEPIALSESSGQASHSPGLSFKPEESSQLGSGLEPAHEAPQQPQFSAGNANNPTYEDWPYLVGGTNQPSTGHLGGHAAQLEPGQDPFSGFNSSHLYDEGLYEDDGHRGVMLPSHIPAWVPPADVPQGNAEQLQAGTGQNSSNNDWLLPQEYAQEIQHPTPLLQPNNEEYQPQNDNLSPNYDEWLQPHGTPPEQQAAHASQFEPDQIPGGGWEFPAEYDDWLQDMPTNHETPPELRPDYQPPSSSHQDQPETSPQPFTQRP